MANANGVHHPTTGKYMRTPDQMMVDRRAAELRSAALTWQQIANELGMNDASTAYRAAQRGMADVPVEGVAEARSEELAKLDRRERFLLVVMNGQHMKVDRGHVVHHNGVPVVDDAPGIAAANSLDRVQKRRPALLGLDAPVQRIVEVITEEAVQAEILRLEAIAAELPE
jgi:hypothetical protein